MANDWFNKPADISGPVTDSDINSRMTAVDDAFDKLPTPNAVSGAAVGFGANTGGANGYVVTLSPAPTAYLDGMVVRSYAIADNTGAMTLNVNGLGVKDVLAPGGDPLRAGQIPVDRLIEMVYHSGSFYARVMSLSYAGPDCVNLGERGMSPANSGVDNVAAFDNATLSGQVFYLPPGTYKVEGGLKVTRTNITLVAEPGGTYQNGGVTTLRRQGVIPKDTSAALIMFGDGSSTLQGGGMAGSWRLYSTTGDEGTPDTGPIHGLWLRNVGLWRNAGVISCEGNGGYGVVIDGARQCEFGTLFARKNLLGGIQLSGKLRSANNNTCVWLEANSNGGYQLGLIMDTVPNRRVGQVTIRGLFEAFNPPTVEGTATVECLVKIEACTDVVFENVNFNAHITTPNILLGNAEITLPASNQQIDGLSFVAGQLTGGSDGFSAVSDTVRFMRVTGTQWISNGSPGAFLDATGLTTANSKIVLRDGCYVESSNVTDPGGVVIATYVFP